MDIRAKTARECPTSFDFFIIIISIISPFTALTASSTNPINYGRLTV